MQLSEKTLNVLRNYASINPNIVIEQGNKLSTISEAKNVLSSATVDVEFPREIGIYDLGQFLNVLSMMTEPDLEFYDDHVAITDSSGRSSIVYRYSDLSILTKPKSGIKMPSVDVSFTLDADTLNKVKKAANVLGHTQVAVRSAAGEMVLAVLDNSDSTSNVYTIDISGESDLEDDFTYIFNIANLKLIEGDYDVQVSSKGIGYFVNKDSGVEYWISIEKN